MAVTDQALFEQIARLSVGRKQELAALCFVENVNKALDPLRMNISKVAAGAIWADARLPSEYNYEHIEGVINLPLNEIRNLAGKLDASKEYVVLLSNRPPQFNRGIYLGAVWIKSSCASRRHKKPKVASMQCNEIAGLLMMKWSM